MSSPARFAVVAVMALASSRALAQDDSLEGRITPAVISFFGWASIPPTALGISLLAANAAGFNNGAGVFVGAATFIGVSVTCAAVMTVLDVYFARRVSFEHGSSPEREQLKLSPAVIPVRSGVLAGITGVW